MIEKETEERDKESQSQFTMQSQQHGVVPYFPGLKSIQLIFGHNRVVTSKHTTVNNNQRHLSFCV